MWDLSCPDWEQRLLAGESLIPDLPLFEDEADMGLAFFDQLVLPDVPGRLVMRDAAGIWFRQLVRVIFGSRDPATNERMIREFFALVPKGQAKTTYSAGVMVTALLMNQRPRAEMLFVGPTQAIADRAFSQAAGMIAEDPTLKERFKVIEHQKEIRDLLNDTTMNVKTFALDILTGSMPVVVLLDEIHLLGRNPHAGKVLRQIRGGLEKNSEGFLLTITTQSDEPPAGVMKEELHTARRVRDGHYKGEEMRAILPMLYEFPQAVARDPAQWQNPELWHLVMPNLGRSMRLDSLVRDWTAEKAKGDHATRVWASQHLNIEIGVGLKTDSWPGAEFWEQATDETLTLGTLIERSEAIVIGADGGGLDDLFGLSVLGREKGTKRWLSWSTAWAHQSVLQRRQTIAPRLLDFAKAHLEGGDLFYLPGADDDDIERELHIIDDELVDVAEELGLGVDEMLLPKDVAGILRIAVKVNEAGLLAAMALDMEGPYGELIDALALVGITQEGGQVVGIGQGYKLMHAIKGMERKLANGTLVHARSALMDWCVSNIKIEPTATAIRATKQNAGDAKIDPAMALFDAGSVMQTNPEPKRAGSYLEQEDLIIV